MKRTVLFVACVLILAGVGAAQRLPGGAIPQNYKLTFTPDLEKATFAGQETITIQMAKPATEIVLNAADITFQSVTITSGGMTQTAKVSADKDKEMATLTVEKPLAAGTATVQIQYTGILNDQMRGLYLGKDGAGRKYVSTQFESTDARRAFPSFDEPAYKATFDITVIADKGLVAISNSKVASDTPGPGNNQHTVRFATTPKMSTYLAALVVGNFEYIEGEADGIPIRVYGTPGTKQLGTFSLSAAEAIMRYFDRYFGVKYPYGKLDLVGIPDFSAGAMENTGCITFREVVLQLDEQHASASLKKTVAEVIAHEMAHQWFGDLVTMQWWDDVWLNEGFATWMESKPVEDWKPEWHVELDDVSDSYRTLGGDSLANTRPIHQPADTPAQIQELFDGIAYGKAAAVLRMIEAYIGPKTFQAGVNEYIKEHANSNATSADFWNALAKVSKKPVDKVMPTFVKQAGAPLVSVKSQCTGNSTSVTLSQQRYFFDRALFNAGSSEVWEIPVCLKSKGADGKSTDKCELLTQKEESFTLPGCASWVMANAGASGYYRSAYEPQAVEALARDAESVLTPGERIALLADTWAAVRVDRQPIGDYLMLAAGLQADRNRAVLDDLLAQLDAIGTNLLTDSDRPAYQQWVQRLLTPVAKDVGWEAKPGESDEQRTLRARLLYTLGYTARDPEALAVARKLADQVLENPASVDRELAFSALPLAALNGDAALYDKILEKTKHANSPEEYFLYLQNLSRFGDPQLLQRTLDLAISGDIRSQDVLQVVSGVMRNPAGQKLAWDFVRSHWPDMEKVGGPFASAQIVGVAGSFCDAGLRDEVKDFFSAHKVPSAERTFKQSLERINYCVDLKTQQSTQLASWLEHKGGSAGK